MTIIPLSKSVDKNIERGYLSETCSQHPSQHHTCSFTSRPPPPPLFPRIHESNATQTNNSVKMSQQLTIFHLQWTTCYLSIA